MKKIFTLALLCTFAGSATPETTIASTSSSVYICTGGSSTKYHATSTCRGLDACKGRIIEITKYDAENKHYRNPCKICKP